jgi:F420H(2)-dependent quinone reductase
MAKRSGGFGRAVGRTFLRAAVWTYRRSGGRIGGRMAGVPLLLLTTTGRRSGRPWTVPLMYQPVTVAGSAASDAPPRASHGDDDGWVIIASNGGSSRHPSWWLNLRSTPEATIQIGREVMPVAGEEVTAEEAGGERERLWRVMTRVYPTYDKYATKTSRTIPVVRLRRR